MKKIIFLVFVLVAGYLFSQENISALMPMPNKIHQRVGYFQIQDKLCISNGNNSKLSFATAQLQRILKDRLNISGIVANVSSKADISLVLDVFENDPEAYKISVSEKGIQIRGCSVGAILYGITTLDQILLGDVVNTKQNKIACISIEDKPRFKYRALMLDPARHFIPLEDVKFYIDQMARYKFNILQLHLTDDQGWRVEIKKHPKLVEIGAHRKPAENINKTPHNGFYTQAQLKELIAYAAERAIEIVPEFDIPGHTVAVLAAYPELGCSNTLNKEKKVGKTTNLMLCASNPKVYELCKDIICELAEIFPSKRIHLGGDESVIDKNWGQCEHCKALMRQKGLKKADQLMNVFFGNILASVRSVGKEPILWCELDNIRLPAKEYLFDYPKDATLVTWRNNLTPLCLELTKKHGNQIIMAPGEFCYLDYPQYKGDFPEFNNWGMPITTLKRSYEFDPAYGKDFSDNHILGVMGTLWGEAIQNVDRATYMTFPRAFALSEAAWTQMKYRNWDSFKKRLFPHILDLTKKGVSVRAPFEIGNRK